jgi:purine-binding chemotaxis protein CheW
VPKVLNRGAGEAHIDAMLRTPEGGLVSVLAPERLFRDDSVAQILADGRRRGNDMALAGESERVERFLVFTLGEERYGLPLEVVEEVVVLPQSLTRVPGAPAFMAGVMNVRGRVLPVVDQRRRFEAPQAEQFARPRVVVARVGETNVGFAVDAVTEILAVPQSRIGPTPELAGEGGRVFDRVARADEAGGMILLVDPGALLDRAEADLLAEIARRATPPP